MMHSAEVPEETAMEILDSLSVVLLAVPGMAHLTQAPGSHGYKELGFLSWLPKLMPGCYDRSQQAHDFFHWPAGALGRFVSWTQNNWNGIAEESTWSSSVKPLQARPWRNHWPRFFSNEDLMRTSVISALGALPDNLHLQEKHLALQAFYSICTTPSFMFAVVFHQRYGSWAGWFVNIVKQSNISDILPCFQRSICALSFVM